MVAPQKFLAKNDAGDVVFNIELKNSDSISHLNLNCSIGIDFESNPGMKYLMDKLLSANTDPQSKAFMIQELLSSIKSMEALKGSSSDTEPKKPFVTLGESENVLIFMIAQDEAGELVSINEPQRAFRFKDVANMLAGCIVNLEKIDRSDFEKIISGQAELEDQYIESYTTNASFYTTAVLHRNKCYRYFIMHPNETTE